MPKTPSLYLSPGGLTGVGIRYSILASHSPITVIPIVAKRREESKVSVPIPSECDETVFAIDQISWIPAYAGMTGGGAVSGTGNHKGCPYDGLAGGIF